MSAKNNQRKYVEESIRRFGYISRNHCLGEFITRLSAIICDMQKHGYLFETSKVATTHSKWGKGYDYVYTVVAQPTDPIYYEG